MLETDGAITPNLIVRGVVAGLLGGILIDAFLLLSHAAQFPELFQFIASGVIGSVAYTSAGYVWFGLCLHFAISTVWGIFYALAATAGHFVHRWILGAIGLGLFVAIVMQIVTALAHLGHVVPIPSRFAISVLSHVVFFALPIAWYVANGPPNAQGPLPHRTA